MRHLNLFLIFVFGLCGQYPAFAATEPVVSVAEVTSEHLSPTMMVSGRVQSRASTSLSSGISGKLMWVAEPGHRVEAGQMVARLDDKPQRLVVRQLQARLKRIEISVHRLERQLHRYDQLHRTQAISDTQKDDLSSELALARADKQVLEIELEQAREDLARTLIIAPFDGVITQRFKHQGEDISHNQSVLELVNTEQLEVAVHGPLQYSSFAEQLGTLQVFMGNQHHTLPLRALIPVSDSGSQSFSAFLSVPEHQTENYHIGQLVSVAIPTAAPAEQYLVPRDAIVLSDKLSRVYVLDNEQKAIAITVELGEGQGEYISVSGALSVGQQVIVRGAETLQPGQTVRILDAGEFPLSTLKS